MINKKYLLILSSHFGLCDESLRAYEDGAEEDLMALYGGEEFISIATGVEQPLHKAPAVVSVLTAKRILSK